MIRKTMAMGALLSCVGLAGCFDIPDYRGGGLMRSRASAPTAPVGAPLGTPMAPLASAAENACTEAGRAAGFDVRGVVGTREVTGTGGLPESRDVMLRVQRGGQSLDVRCSYAYAGGAARIMTL